MGGVSLGRVVVRRFFAFGCSFTNYRWRTWADILGEQYDHYENWGQAGAGNHYIFNAVMECDQRRLWQTGDTVIVCWTNVTREDRYVNDRWLTMGNVATSQCYTKEFVTEFVSDRGCVIRDMAMIKAVKVLLEARGVTWRFISMCPLPQADPWDTRKLNDCQDVYSLYQDVMDHMLPSFTEILGVNFWQYNQDSRVRYPAGVIDYHPTPQEHLHYLDTVLPGWVHDSEVRRRAEQDKMTPSRCRNGSNHNQRL